MRAIHRQRTSAGLVKMNLTMCSHQTTKHIAVLCATNKTYLTHTAMGYALYAITAVPMEAQHQELVDTVVRF